MELLLIFSAMLSALTGAVTSACEPEARLQQAEAAVTAAEAAVIVVQAQTPPAAMALPPAGLPSIEMPARRDLTIVASAPLAFVRLNE